MIMYLYLLFQTLLVPVYTYTFQDRGDFSCNYDSKHMCIDNNLRCAWCNNTVLNASCNQISSCDVNSQYYDNCEFINKKMLKTVCYVSDGLYVLLLACGYIVSMIVIYSTIDRLLMNEKVSLRTRNSVKFIVFTLTSVPLLMSFLFYEVIFYFLFISIITSGFCISCCIKNRRIITIENEPLLNNNNTQ